MTLSSSQLELLARALRETVSESPLKEEATWETIKGFWIRDASFFLQQLEDRGMEVVPVKSSPKPIVA